MEYKYLPEDIKGWFDNIDYNIFNMLLSIQHENQFEGNYAELGVYYGRSLIALQENSINETIDAIDLYTDFLNYNTDILSTVQETVLTYTNKDISNINFIRTNTLEYQITAEKMHTCKFVHLDACHNEISVKNDLILVDNLLTDNGIIVLDDWNNGLYPGVQKAFYEFNSLHNNCYKIILISKNKCYICKSEYYNFYSAYIKNIVETIVENVYLIKAIKTKNMADNDFYIILGLEYNINISDNEYEIVHNIE